MQFVQFLSIPPEYELARMMSSVLLLTLAIITSYYNHKLKKMEAQNEELNQRVKEQEAELSRLRQQSGDTANASE